MIRDKKHWEWVDTFIPKYVNLLDNCDYDITKDLDTIRELQTYIRTKDNERWNEYISQKFDVWAEAVEWAEDIVRDMQEEFPDKELGEEEIEYLTYAIYEQDKSNYDECVLKYAHNLTFTWTIPGVFLSEDTVYRNSFDSFVEDIENNYTIYKIPFGAIYYAYKNANYEGDFIIGFRLDRETVDKIINNKEGCINITFKDIFFGLWNYDLGGGSVDKIEDINMVETISCEDLTIDEVYGSYGWSAIFHNNSLDATKVLVE